MLLALLRLLGNLLRLPGLPLWWLSRLFTRSRASWVIVRVSPRIVELRSTGIRILSWIPGLSRAMPTPLSLLRRLADRVAEDPGVEGLAVVLPSLQVGWATAQSLRAILGGLRDRGKQVAVYLPEGAGNKELYVATAGSRVILAPQATVIALGLSVSTRYLKPLLDRLGVAVQSYGRGEYKTAAEPLVRDRMSEPQREQLTALLSTLDAELIGALASRPALDETSARALLAEGIVRGPSAVEVGLADELAYEDDLPRLLTGRSGPRAGRALMRAPRYLAVREGTFFAPVLPRPYVAVVEVRGVIADRAPILGVRGAAAEAVVAALRTAGEDRHAVGVVLHVVSPGGSAQASDRIHREVVRLTEKKPVVACLGDVAASGGYYVAAPAGCIVAQPTTVTGSIGVIAVKLVMEELLSTLGVHTEVLRTSPHADMFSVGRPMDETEQALLAREIDGFYESFLQVVAKGRGLSREAVDAVARGRVWSGADARERGLVDRLGALDAAVGEVHERAGVPPGLRDRVRPRRVHPRRLDVKPPDPQPADAPAALTALLRDLAPEAVDLLALTRGGARVLYYATGLPKLS